MKVAIVGCGLIGSKRAEALPRGVELVGCFDAIPQNADKFARLYKTTSFDSFQELLNTEKLDAVIVATQHNWLAPISLEVLKAGFNVFVEKPGAINFQQLEELVNEARRSNLHIHIGYNHPHHPAIAKALEIADSPDFGKVMFVRGRYGHGGRVGYEKEWRADKLKSGGGELIDQGTHLLDLSVRLLGDLVLDYAATPTYFWDMPVEDNVFISVKNEFGNIAFLQASCTEWKNMFSLEIYGQYGKLDIFGLGKSYGVETLTYYKMLPEMGPPNSETWTFDGLDNSWSIEMLNFFEDIKAGSRYSDNTESSLQVLRLIGEIYQRNNK